MVSVSMFSNPTLLCLATLSALIALPLASFRLFDSLPTFEETTQISVFSVFCFSFHHLQSLTMGDWSHGLCGCLGDCGLCIQTFCCPCVTAGQNAEATDVGGCCLCGLAFFVPFLGCFFTARSRQKAREMKQIQGSFVGDVCCTLCCPACVLVQTARELKTPTPQQMNRA
uniref:Uncharacterized protein n=1 Tax=Eptatretus burgeri TaxID=7764 RepID=A0A8C4R4N0_EPTBU